MGNHKFRLSDMIPNAWFYKLKEMGTKPPTTTTSLLNNNNSNSNSINSKEKKKKKTKHTQAYSATTPPPIPRHFEPQTEYDHHYLSRPRKSYHFTRKLVNKKCPNSPPPSPPLHHHHDHDHDQTQHHTLVDPPPRKSSRKRRPRRPNLSKSTSTSSSSPSSASAGWSCRAVTATATTVHSFLPTPTKTEPPISNLLEIPSDSTLLSSGEGRCSCHSDRRDDTIIDVDQNSLANKSQQNNKDAHQIGSGPGSTAAAAAATTTCTLPPIKTEHYNTAPRQLIDNDPKNSFKQAIPNNPSLKKAVALKRREEDHSSVAVALAALPRRFSSSSAAAAAAAGGSPGGIRLRVNSPRIARITPGITGRGSRRASSSSKPIISSESLAVVKSSSDPQKDFRDSMVEMILENNINTSKGLEDLLACYLSLNADEYHHLIVNVFKQIWFDLKTNNTTATNTTAASATKLIRRRTTRRGSPYQLQLVA